MCSAIERLRQDVRDSARPASVRLNVEIIDQLLAAVDGLRGVDAANSLCEACANVLGVDAAAISLVFDGVNTATLGCSSPRAREYDELQFTLGEGPCLDSVARRTTVMVPDLADMPDRRWPAYAPAMMDMRIRSVHAVPIAVAGEYIGALDLFRVHPGKLTGAQLGGAAVAAELAGIPLLDLLDNDMQAAVNDPGSSAWVELNALSRSEVSQATGVLAAQLQVEAAEALIRLRAHAFSTGRAVTDVARDILERRLRLEAD